MVLTSEVRLGHVAGIVVRGARGLLGDDADEPQELVEVRAAQRYIDLSFVSNAESLELMAKRNDRLLADHDDAGCSTGQDL